MIIHESTLNIKLAAVPTLWSISPLPPQPPPPPPPPEDAHQHIQWVRGSRHLYTCMHACMYLCKVVVGKRYAHAIAFHCVRVMATSCVHVRLPY